MKKEEGLCQYRRICPGSNVFTGKVNVEGSGLTVQIVGRLQCIAHTVILKNYMG